MTPTESDVMRWLVATVQSLAEIAENPNLPDATRLRLQEIRNEADTQYERIR